MVNRTQLTLYICGPALIIAFVLFGVLFEIFVDKRLEQRAYVCDKDNYYYDAWHNTKDAGATLKRHFYFYNVTNPTAALNGDSFVITEVGPFTYKYSMKKYDVDFQHNGTVRYRQFTQFTYSDSSSCEGCTEYTPINTINLAWQVLLLSGRSEGVMMLSSQCTKQQIQLIASMTTAVCAANERNTATACRCCDPAGASGTKCTSLVDPTQSTASALLSWFAMFDSGSKVSDANNPSFPILNAIYSPALIASNPREIVGGRASTLMGVIQAKSAVMTGDTNTLSTLAKFTSDYYAACESHCPDATAIRATWDAPTTTDEVKGALLMTKKCSGQITEDDATIDGDVHEYLIGMSCKSATPTFWSQFVLESATCASGGSDSLPCCTSSGLLKITTSSPAVPMPGWGCVKELQGYTLTRKTSKQSEWDETNDAEYEQITGCHGTGKKNAQTYTAYKSERSYPTWYSPPSYTFPNMPYADTVYPNGVRSGSLTEGVHVSVVDGKEAANRKPKGFSSSFFEYQATDGKLPDASFNIFSKTLQQAVEFTFDKATTIKKINVARFTTNYTSLTAQTEENQQLGFGVPYKGIYAGLQYALGAPVFISYPHFFDCASEAYEQSDNTALGTTSTNGLQMYTRVTTYSGGEPLSTDLTPIDQDYTKDNEGLYELTMLVDPFTGKAVSSTVVLMISTTLWRCSPLVDPSCGFFVAPGDLSMCYVDTTRHISYPCSASNAFSPKMLGGKIIPNFFIKETNSMDDDSAETFYTAFDTRQASHIMLVIGVVLGVAMVAIAYYLGVQQSKGLERLESKHANVPAEVGLSEVKNKDDRKDNANIPAGSSFTDEAL